MSKNINIKKIVISVAVILLLVILDQFTKVLAQSAAIQRKPGSNSRSSRINLPRKYWCSL